MERYKITRKNALPLGAAIKEYLRSARLTTGLNTRLIFKAWDDVSGAGQFTLKRYFRSGKLYITLNSSVVLSQLSSRKEFLKEMLNDRLSRDELFEQDDQNATWVEEIILK
ncbi:MAG: DUF721 domain-containing protein [Bacteroidales bacterium]|nr:DUF721 domain-containing protein [Bacteroidales bacterium]